METTSFRCFRVQLSLKTPMHREIEQKKPMRQVLTTDNFLGAIRAIQKRVAKLPILDSRPAHEILYDENGLPN
jgi:hypothetical protein